jgi:hypothetical protein
MSAGGAPRIDRAAVALFLVVAFGAAWLITLPLWLSGRGLQTPGAVVLMAAMMVAPTLGVLAVVLLRGRKGILLATGLRSPGGFRSWWRWGLLAFLGAPLLSLAATALAAAVGVFPVDLAGFSGYQAVLHASGGDRIPLSVPTLVVLQLVQIPTVGWLNVLPALAENGVGGAGCCPRCCRWAGGRRSWWWGWSGGSGTRRSSCWATTTRSTAGRWACC